MIFKTSHVAILCIIVGIFAGWLYGPIFPVGSPLIGSHKASTSSTTSAPTIIKPTPLPSFTSSYGPTSVLPGGMEQLRVVNGQGLGLSCFMLVPGYTQQVQQIDNNSPVSACEFTAPKVTQRVQAIIGVQQNKVVLKQYTITIE